MQKAAIALFALMASNVYADLNPIDEETLSKITGQAQPVLDISGQISYDRIIYTAPDGSKEEILPPDGSSTASAANQSDVPMVNQDGVQMEGMTFGLPKTGTIADLLGAVLPLSVGEVDTNGDGAADRGAAVFNFKPNVGYPATPINIQKEDTTVAFNDSVFITKQGIVFLNAPINTDVLYQGTNTLTDSPSDISLRYQHQDSGYKLF